MGKHRGARPPRLTLRLECLHFNQDEDIFTAKCLDEEIRNKLAVGKWTIDQGSVRLLHLGIACMHKDFKDPELLIVPINAEASSRFRAAAVPCQPDCTEIGFERIVNIADAMAVDYFSGQKTRIFSIFSRESKHGCMFTVEGAIRINRKTHLASSISHVTVKPHNESGGADFSTEESALISNIKNAQLRLYGLECTVTKVG